jgi:hypothetical protein
MLSALGSVVVSKTGRKLLMTCEPVIGNCTGGA